MVFITFGDYFRVSSPFRTHLVVLFTFYLGEGCHQLFLVWAFSSALTCVFSCFQAHKQHPSGGGGASCMGGRSPTGGGPRSRFSPWICEVCPKREGGDAPPPSNPPPPSVLYFWAGWGWVGSCPYKIVWQRFRIPSIYLVLGLPSARNSSDFPAMIIPLFAVVTHLVAYSVVFNTFYHPGL